MLLINDLLRHNKALNATLKHAVNAVIDSGWYVLGDNVKQFEKEFAQFCEVEYCVSVANGTEALELSLRALGVGANDTVVTVANAGGYATTAILAVGANPQYVEIDPDTLLISIDNLRELLASATPRAVVVTHLYGQAAAMDAILLLTEQYNIPVIEDCAQAHGAVWQQQKVGSFGAVGCFSFYPSKNLGALGDGGAITTRNSALAERLYKLRQYGWEKKYETCLTGGRNSRLDEMQAAILRVKLPYLESWNQRRYEISKQYITGIHHPAIQLPIIAPGSFVGHLFVLRTAGRESLRAHLKEHKIMSDVHYPIPDYLQPAFKERFNEFSLPLTEKACDEILTLPCFAEMEDAEVKHVIQCVNNWKKI